MTFAAVAQNSGPLQKFYDSLEDSSLELSYTYSARVSGVQNRGAGDLLCQGAMWKAKGNGVEMYCDAVSVWVVDTEMKEVVIEAAADGNSSDFMTNPALMLTRLQEKFDVTVTRLLEDGVTMLYTLRPKSAIGFDYFNVELDKSSSLLKRASFAMSDGTLVKIEVSSMKLTPKVSVEAFRPATVFDSQWIVTDLR